MSSIQGRASSVSSIGGLTALNSSYTPSRNGKAPLEQRKMSLEAELSRVLQLPASVADRDQRALRIRRHIALLERHIALIDAANGERAEFTVQGRADRDADSQREEQPKFVLPEEESAEAPAAETVQQAAARKPHSANEAYARPALNPLDFPGSLYSPPAAPGAVQPWETRPEPTRAAKLGRNFDVSV